MACFAPSIVLPLQAHLLRATNFVPYNMVSRYHSAQRHGPFSKFSYNERMMDRILEQLFSSASVSGFSALPLHGKYVDKKPDQVLATDNTAQPVSNIDDNNSANAMLDQRQQGLFYWGILMKLHHLLFNFD